MSIDFYVQTLEARYLHVVTTHTQLNTVIIVRIEMRLIW